MQLHLQWPSNATCGSIDEFQSTLDPGKKHETITMRNGWGSYVPHSGREYVLAALQVGINMHMFHNS